MKFIGIIPARFQSTRFPGKPLALIHGKPMIQWVVSRVSEALDEVWVATDHEAIYEAVHSFGGKAIMTESNHQSGTDRCAEAARKLEGITNFDVIINVQGDEPFIMPQQINELISCFSPEVEIATLVKEVSDPAELFNPNRPKVVVGTNRQALYFSRSVIPFIRGTAEEEWTLRHSFLLHIGMYGYKKEALQEITQLKPGKLEMAESLEQLRWLENGYRIQTALTNFTSFGIDTPEDLQQAILLFPGDLR